MMKKYKVHTDFDLDYITQEDPCRCTVSDHSIFSNISAASAKQLQTLGKPCSRRKQFILDFPLVLFDSKRRLQIINFYFWINKTKFSYFDGFT